MKIETYLAKYYDVEVVIPDDAAIGERHIEIYEKGDDCEPIGLFVTFEGMDTFQYRNIYGEVESGTAYNEKMLKDAAKKGVFL